MMNERRANLEAIAPTVEEAIEKGLAELGLSRDQVEVKVLDEGGRGLLGFGSRQARVRLTIIDDADDSTEAATPAQASVSRQAPSDPESQEAIEIARATVIELLERMGVNAEVTAYVGESDDDRYDPPIIVDVQGRDLSFLIGRRAETLNALQFITRLIVGKELGRGAHIVVDVAGYRGRREMSLRQLARRMARQAIKSGRVQKLEPMPPNERRIVHLELRDHPHVTTQSEGEDPRRKVTIIPK
jgi:spoIIIJ-associated protein